MTQWELRGYLTYPRKNGMPRAGTPEELSWARGWNRAMEEAELGRKSDYHLQLENDALYGRDTFAASYRDEKDFRF